MMMKIILSTFFVSLFFVSSAQSDLLQQNPGWVSPTLSVEKSVAATPVKNQSMTGTCWCFSTISLVESQCIKKGLGQMDISEMFSVRNIYLEKAKNYILRQGNAQFGEGGLGHDLIRAIATYGAVPENVYSGLKGNQKMHNHSTLARDLKQYLDSVLKLRPLPQSWVDAYIGKLDLALGTPPAKFIYQGKIYTPKTFADEVLKFDADEYVNITSFTHHPFYTPFIIEVPDNFSNGAYYNLPLNEMIAVTKDAINTGYSVMWDADVSNSGFMQNAGIAAHYDSSYMTIMKKGGLSEAREYAIQQETQQQKKEGLTDGEVTQKKNSGINTQGEAKWNTEIRQALFESLTTQDDHLMHITGTERSKDGKTYFLVKNSWGEIGPKKGYISVSEAYFAINTISLIIPKAALSNELLEKLKIK
jgi:bleomycin hydrolase